MLVTLAEWANITFEGSKPSIITMRRWAVMGKFNPRAVKIGRLYYVEKQAKFVGRTRSDIGHERNKSDGKIGTSKARKNARV